MKRKLLFLLLLWLGTKLKLAYGFQLQTFHFPIQPGAKSNLTAVPNKVFQVCRPGWDINDRLVCRHSNYKAILLHLGRKTSLQEGWQVFCPMGQLQSGSCQVTPPDSQCMMGGLSYVGNICDFTKFHEPQDDALSNQTSDPDENRNFVKYIAIGIFVGAFLFPCGLGLCCYYCGEDPDDREQLEVNDNRVTCVEHTISVVGRNPSTSASEIELQNSEVTPPTYEACNEAADAEED